MLRSIATVASALFRSVRRVVGFTFPTSEGQRRALAGLVATAMDERIPLAPLLRAWADDERGWQSERVGRLAATLESGVPLETALAKSAAAFHPGDLASLRWAARVGTGAGKALARADESGADSVERTIRGTIVYGLTIATVSVLTAAFIAIRITPRFRRIFDDFGMEMPPWNDVADRLSGFVAATWFLLPLLLVALLLMPVRLRRRVVRRCGLGGLGVLGDARSAEVLDTLATTAAEGGDADAALSALEASADDRVLAARLRRGAGVAPVSRALSAAGLVTPAEASLIGDGAERSSGWVTGALARQRRARVIQRLWCASELLLPVVVLLMGAFVLVESLGLMTPLFKLIMDLT